MTTERENFEQSQQRARRAIARGVPCFTSLTKAGVLQWSYRVPWSWVPWIERSDVVFWGEGRVRWLKAKWLCFGVSYYYSLEAQKEGQDGTDTR